jgi:nitrite reductase (NADH) large subunit
MSGYLAIVGNGIAAAKLLEQLSARTLGRYAIAVIGEEPQLAHNRVLLPSVLADDIAQPDIKLKSGRCRRDRGATLPHSKLVFATGSRPLAERKTGLDMVA